jgi:hypothetical protein
MRFCLSGDGDGVHWVLLCLRRGGVARGTREVGPERRALVTLAPALKTRAMLIYTPKGSRSVDDRDVFALQAKLDDILPPPLAAIRAARQNKPSNRNE